MDSITIITILSALLTTLGVKEIWNIWKKKIDLEAKKDSKIDEIYLTIIKDLKTQIGKLEEKVDNLILENIALRENVARLDERIK